VTIGFTVPGDLAVSADGRRLVLNQGAEEYAGRVRSALELFQGYWRYDTTRGLRFIDTILEKPASTGLDLLRSEVRRVIAKLPGTQRVLSVSANYDSTTRTVAVTWIAKSVFGTVSGDLEIA
jgi:hypothetical protein